MAAKPITQQQYSQAVSAHESISGAIGSLQDVTTHVINKSVLKSIRLTIAGLQNELFVHAKIIEASTVSINDIDPGLLGVAANRAKELADKIRVNKGAITRAVRSYQLGASPSMPTDDDIDGVEFERAALESELSKINEFLLDGDKARLRGTSLEAFIND